VSELTLLILRIAFLALLWFFVFAIIYALRTDLFGQRVRKLQAENAERASAASIIAPGAAAANAAGIPAPAPAAVPTAAPIPAPSSGRAGWPFDTTGLTAPVATAGTGAAKAATASTPSPGANATRLVITSGAKSGMELPLGTDTLTIGRASESGLVIRDDYTSTHHARLMLWDKVWMVQDLDSTNGTFVDGQKVSAPVPVPLNKPIRIGTTTFELRA